MATDQPTRRLRRAAASPLAGLPLAHERQGFLLGGPLILGRDRGVQLEPGDGRVTLDGEVSVREIGSRTYVGVQP